MRLHVEYAHTLDADEWGRRHAAGLVPNRLPYGLHWLRSHGFELNVLPAAKSRFVSKLAGGVGRRASGGFDLVDALRDRRRRCCDLALCWDERTGVPAALRSRITGEPPAAMGTLWMTDPYAHPNAVARRLSREGARSAALIWANTEEQLRVLADWGVPPSRLHLLRTPGLDVEFWRPDGRVPEPGLVVAAGNDRHRDHPFLVAALARLSEHGTGGVRPRLELVTEHRVPVPPDLGRRIDHLPHHELRALYGRAAVVAVALKPNIHVSGSTVILEAMACERPVVVTEMPGIREYVVDGKTGLVVPPGDAGAFGTAIRELLSDPDRARDLGRAGRRRVEGRFSSELLVARLAEIIRSV
jgi:glycosyltransferase involved in cell wall biosynthesis